MDVAISPLSLKAAMASGSPPLLVDVRRAPVFAEASDFISGALRRSPEEVAVWASHLPRSSNVVVYCVHGHQVSQGAARALHERGIRARYLDHGIEGWREAGGALMAKAAGASTRWVTRERPKIDRIACPWLVARFIDRDAEFLYVPPADVRSVANERAAAPYDVADVEFAHVGDRCSFDAFIERFHLGADPALAQLATIVRAADTGRLELAPQAAGLLATSIGLSHLFRDDHEMLEHGMVLYDALYRWCREGHDEAHMWNPVAC